jgi:hypothetical protein
VQFAANASADSASIAKLSPQNRQLFISDVSDEAAACWQDVSDADRHSAQDNVAQCPALQPHTWSERNDNILHGLLFGHNALLLTLRDS